MLHHYFQFLDESIVDSFLYKNTRPRHTHFTLYVQKSQNLTCLLKIPNPLLLGHRTSQYIGHNEKGGKLYFVGKISESGKLCGFIEISIIENNDGILSSQFKGHRFQIACCCSLHYQTTNFCRSSKSNLEFLHKVKMCVTYQNIYLFFFVNLKKITASMSI